MHFSEILSRQAPLAPPAYVMAARGSPRPDLGARTEENWRSERRSGKATRAPKKLANSTASKLEKLSFLCRRPRFAAPQRTQRPFVGGKSARITPFPSCWDDLKVMDDVPDSGLFMGSNVFLAAGDPVGMGMTRIPPVGRRSRTIWHCSALPPDRTSEFGYLRKNQGERG